MRFRIACPVLLLASVPFNVQGIEKKNQPPNFGMSVSLPNSLHGKIYNLQPETTRLPDFDHLKPVGSVFTYSLNVPERMFTEGMPGVTSRIEWFAIDYEGDFWIQVPGKYRFALTSDDGSRLYIDDKLIIDNDGVHAPVLALGNVQLERGAHHMRVAYFQGPRYSVALVLHVAPPGEKLRVFDMRSFTKPLDPEAQRTTESELEEDSRPVLRRASAAHDVEASKLYEVNALAALDSRPLPHAFDFRAGAYRFRPLEDSAQYVLAFELPLASLTLAAEPELKRHKLHAVLLARVKDANGQVVAKVSRDTPLEIPDEKLGAVRSATITYTNPLRLPPGHYTLETVVVDRQGNQSSASLFEIDNSERRGVGLSSVVLVKRVESVGRVDESDPFQFQGRRVIPDLTANLAKDAQPHVYFVVYPDKSAAEKPKIGVELLMNGQVLAKQTGDLPEADATGAIPMTIDTVAVPGTYEVKITALQAGGSMEQTVKYSIAGK